MYIMKEITPFLYTSLYSHGCLDNFEQLYTKFGTHMLTHENKKAWSSTNTIIGNKIDVLEIITKPEEPVPVIVPVVVPIVTQITPHVLVPRRFSPKKPDTLFWSIFVAHYGVDEFLQIGSKYMNREIEEKTHTMEFLGKNRPLQKSLKITAASGQEIMGDLMTNKH